MSGIFLLHYVFSYPYVNETPVNYVRNYMGSKYNFITCNFNAVNSLFEIGF